jgi:hypothetical protein
MFFDLSTPTVIYKFPVQPWNCSSTHCCRPKSVYMVSARTSTALQSSAPTVIFKMFPYSHTHFAKCLAGCSDVLWKHANLMTCCLAKIVRGYNYSEAYRPVTRQRPRSKQRVQLLLWNRRIIKVPFLSNGSVNAFPRKRYPPMLYSEDPRLAKWVQLSVGSSVELGEGGWEEMAL